MMNAGLRENSPLLFWTSESIRRFTLLMSSSLKAFFCTQIFRTSSLRFSEKNGFIWSSQKPFWELTVSFISSTIFPSLELTLKTIYPNASSICLISPDLFCRGSSKSQPSTMSIFLSFSNWPNRSKSTLLSPYWSSKSLLMNLLCFIFVWLSTERNKGTLLPIREQYKYFKRVVFPAFEAPDISIFFFSKMVSINSSIVFTSSYLPNLFL